MLNEFWETAPAAYKYTVFAGMALTFIGIALVVIGAITGTATNTIVALPVIGVGLATHMTSMALRGRAIRKQLREAAKK
ncbi:DUF3188 domain-containing protein [Specibacter cremeus]|uniref:DUF3188 domain-containing protein n=1 Tax=Specibacter cremeus TaxID=1629051 RepID=UPI000F773EC2|nr:DUF3188 domain-containing protein [Specibacter cremeus]